MLLFSQCENYKSRTIDLKYLKYLENESEKKKQKCNYFISFIGYFKHFFNESEFVILYSMIVN